ncbi:MAG: tyrosine-type recombinase/integrase [Gudongella sp.]|nr:tyrosine-type recombinase/integrase [Gudongella sp.]
MNRIPKEVEPFKNIKDIQKIKQYLRGKENRRDYTIFVVGINIGLRAGDLLSLKWLDVIENNEIKSTICINEEKTNKRKDVELNKSAKEALQEFKDSLGNVYLDDFIFKSRKGESHLQVRSLHRIIKDMVKELNIKGNYGTHSMRKAFGFHRYMNNISLETLMKVFNHSTQSQTLKYIGITKEVIQDAYNSVNL